jgi:hypothetical protein
MPRRAIRGYESLRVTQGRVAGTMGGVNGERACEVMIAWFSCNVGAIIDLAVEAVAELLR